MLKKYLNLSFNYALIGVLFFIVGASNIYAKDNKLLAQFPYKVNFMTKNPESGLIYATTDNELLIINPQNQTITNIPSWGNLAGLTLSEDKTKLYVSRFSGREIMVLNLTSNEILEPIELPYGPYDLKSAADGYLYATCNSSTSGVMQIDPKNNQFLGLFAIDFSQAPVHSFSMMEISPDHKTLYFGDRGLSLATLTVYKIAKTPDSKKPVFVHQSTLGSNGRDLHLSQNGENLYYAVGSGNNNYDIGRIFTKNMIINGSLKTGPYPVGITTSPDGKIAYTKNFESYIEVWDSEKQIKKCKINIDPYSQFKKMTLDITGRILLIAFDTSLKLYQAGCPD